MGLLVDIKSLLTSVDSSIYLGDSPDSPDNVTALYNTNGRNPDKTYSGSRYEKPSFQVFVRNSSYANGITACESIKDILALVSNQTINSNIYLSIRQIGDIISIGKDDRNRSQFTLNFDCELYR